MKKSDSLLFDFVFLSSIPRYVLLLRELKRHTPPDHPQMEALDSALAKAESIAEHVNESKRHVENMSKLLDIQNRLHDNKFVLFKPDRRLLREGMLKRLKDDYVLSDSSLRPASEHDMVDQLFFLFNDLLLWTTPAFDISGSVEMSKLTCLPNQIATMPYTISLGVRGKPFSADMVFLAKDKEEHDQWLRYLEAAIRTANELEAQGGIRIVHNHNGRGPVISSVSPAPSNNFSPSPPPPQPQQIQRCHELEL